MLWQIKNHRVEIFNSSSGKYEDFCEEIRIDSIFTDLLTGRKNYEIFLFDDLSGGITFTVPASKINRNIVPALAEYGFTQLDNESVNNRVQQILLESKYSATHNYTHNKLGFHKVAGKLAFLAHTPIRVNDSQKSTSEYIYPYKTKPHGALDDWKKVVLNEVIGRPNMELALALSAVPPLAFLLRKSKVLSLIPMIALIGASSTGKSISLKLIASVYGSPEESKGLVSDMNATENALMAQLANNAGIPAIFDETSAYDGNLSKFLYHLPKGREKQRCQAAGELRDPLYFSGAMFFSGEKSVLAQQTNGNEGLFGRLLEITLPWTDDEHHAQRLESGCRQYNGTAVYPLIEWILENQENLSDLFWDEYKFLKNRLPDSKGIEDRLVKTYALIALSACVVGLAWNLPIDINQIRETLLSLHDTNRRRLNSPEKVFEKIKSLILENFACFPTETFVGSARTIWGEYGRYKHIAGFWIMSDKFHEFLAKSHGDEIPNIEKIFFEKGWLARTSDRHYKIPHSLGGVGVKCYFLYLSDKIAVKEPKTTSSHKSNRQIKKYDETEEENRP